MKLRKNWKSFWKFHSAHAMALLTVLPMAWNTMPPELKQGIPDWALPAIAAAVFVGGVIGLVRDQGFEEKPR